MKIFFLLCLVAAAAYAIYRWRNALKIFYREVHVEMQKVAWPSRNDVIGSTIVVLVAVVALTIVISVADEVLSRLLSFFLGKGA